MSVPKSKRGVTKMLLFNKADDLASYTIRICSTENCFPKRYRWSITSKIVSDAIDIDRHLAMANGIFVHDLVSYRRRQSYQQKAASLIDSLLCLINISYDAFSIPDSKLMPWIGLVLEVQKLLKQWIKSDRERYSKWVNNCRDSESVER